MEFLAFPIAGLGFLLLWGAGLSPLAALLLGPTVALFLMAVFLPLLWPTTPRKKPGSLLKIAKDRPRKKEPKDP